MKYIFLLGIVKIRRKYFFFKILQPSDKCDLIFLYYDIGIGTYILMIIIMLCET